MRGERSSRQACRPRIPSHPRMCGENGRKYRGVSTGSGSSPRVRGEPSGRRNEWIYVSGSSPRVRGERVSGGPGGQQCSGHPRVCGENTGVFCCLGAAVRAIPACAGRTFNGDGGLHPDYGPSPRVRGEPAWPLWRQKGVLGGPSPRVRGERHPGCD